MKVLHIFKELNFSGAEVMYTDSVKYFQNQGVELYAMSTGEKLGNFVHRFKNEGYKILRLPLKGKMLNPFTVIITFFKFRKIVKTHKITHIHIHRESCNFTLCMYSIICGIIPLRTLHSIFTWSKPAFYIRTMQRRILDGIFNVTFHSIGSSVDLNERNLHGLTPNLINNWYNDSKYYPASASHVESLKDQLGIRKDVFVILSAGSCTSVKQHYHILEALTKLPTTSKVMYLHLGEGDLQQQEVTLADSLNIKDRVKFIGNVDNVRDYMVCSDVMLMPSQHEGLSIVVLEAMACKLPVILYNVPGLRDMITDNDNGLLIDPNIDALFEALIKYISNSGLRHEKSENAYKYVLEQHNMKSNVDKIIALYEF